ncbi:MAG: histidine phosphatase family protein [Aurantimonas endophytica]|jgi:phosphohistidine phosphatase|uniref:Phosphohistidine phosphatase n=1 Tax=Aurantimonas endophytica TaxID=1522175 RepID=A0A7W6MNG8_9HYPH|nr:histidine phosphatase family protein [Aurantimonas endophytica]MBB4001819.1 phosphohistidine phosphatase [Aurantimonas endophytica]MCO6402544.1 histidine phosphatase family protein [Aurantimonas endophytica]
MSAAPPSRLFILRHAHSSWALPGQRDHQRPLDERGRDDAVRLGEFLAKADWRIDAVASSTATRATETLDLVRPALKAGTPEHLSDSLYALGVEAYYGEARRLGDAEGLLLVGHNPTIEEFTVSLAGDGEAKALETLAAGFPTCGLAIVEFSTPLADITPGAGTLRQLLVPADLGEG